VDPPDEVFALAERPHHGLRILQQEPSRRTKRLGKAKTLRADVEIDCLAGA